MKLPRTGGARQAGKGTGTEDSQTKNYWKSETPINELLRRRVLLTMNHI
uniref:Uncharacterized protein n=1 Tax=Cucumis melo TaxID=3656 RepID=A0A9I9EE38_CUCME